MNKREFLEVLEQAIPEDAIFFGFEVSYRSMSRKPAEDAAISHQVLHDNAAAGVFGPAVFSTEIEIDRVTVRVDFVNGRWVGCNSPGQRLRRVGTSAFHTAEGLRKLNKAVSEIAARHRELW